MLQRHLQETYDYLLEGANRALLEGGSFVPFGAGTRKTGELIHANVELPGQSGPLDHISGLIEGLRNEDQNNGLIAAGLVFDGRARSDDAAALCFHLEAANGRAVEVILPYQRNDKQIAYYKAQITEVAPEVFAVPT